MLLTFCELILGIPRQLSGNGTQHDVETLGGQQLQLDRSATVLKPYWENVQDEHARASQNAIECLQALMKAGGIIACEDPRHPFQADVKAALELFPEVKLTSMREWAARQDWS